ncbi:MAG: cyclodeaminase/cyclohydrolase family protein, partial [Candidatus Hydrogenedentota bacterium]
MDTPECLPQSSFKVLVGHMPGVRCRPSWGLESAILNVEINLGSIKDEKFISSISSELKNLKKD